MFACEFCPRSYSRMDNLKRHKKNSHSTIKQNPNSPENVPSTSAGIRYCKICSMEVPISCWIDHLRSASHKSNRSIVQEKNALVRATSKNRIATHRLYSNQDKTDGLQFPNQLEERAVKLIKNHVESFGSIKVDVKLFGRFLQQQQKQLKSFSTQFQIVCEESDLQELYEGFAFIMKHQYSEFRDKYDGWDLQELLYLDLSMNKFDPLEA